ncbi:MAG: metallophosphoesterase [Oscillospiraceae bacterium]
MAVFVIGDTHLSLTAEKPMDVFRGWVNYVEQLQANWEQNVSEDDTVVVAGDISWGISMEEALADFRFINDLPGKKIFLKGNHDYWWSTKNKMETFLEENGLDTIKIMSNNAYKADGIIICGTRGWLFEKGEPHDQKMVAREAGRLRLSLQEGKKLGDEERVVFLHYPPVYSDEICPEIIDVMIENGIKRCYYGHIHSVGCRYALNGNYLGIDFSLISSDYVKFCPVKVT